MDFDRRAGAWADAGYGRPASPSNEDLGRLVRRAFALKKYTPPALPKVVRALMQLSADDDVDFRKIARLIESDPVVAGHVLRAANSPLYRRNVVRSIEQAVAQRGLAMVREILSLIGLDNAVMRRTHYQRELLEIRDRGLLASRLIPKIAELAGLTDEWLSIAALFSDAGLSASMMLIGAVHEPEPPPLDALFTELFRIHRQTGYHLAQLWELPEPVPTLIRAHHGPLEAPGTQPGSVAALVIADALAMEAMKRARETPPEVEPGKPATAFVPSEPLVPEPRDQALLSRAIAQLALSDEAMAALREEARALHTRLHKES